MKVHISATPEYSREHIIAVVNLMNGIPGHLEFIAGETLTAQQITLKNEKFQNPTEISVLTFNEFFDICQVYRAIYSIPNDEFVVVLSTIQNDRNWFSAFSNNNIFVDATGWEYLTETDGKYGIAYQVIENLFQRLSGINILDVRNEPNIHKRSIGCINDLNGDFKPDVILKLRMGFICKSCRTRAIENGISIKLLNQIYDIIRFLKDELMKDATFNPEITPDKVTVGEKGNVIVGHKSLLSEDLPRTVYIFFLKNIDGINYGSMRNKEPELFDIYIKIRKGAQREKTKRICSSYDSPDDYFIKLASKINKTIIKNIGARESEFYLLNQDETSRARKYKINLSPDYISIDPRF